MSTRGNVLIVGSEAIMTNLLRILLERGGYQVNAVHNKSAIKRVDTDTADLIVYDIPPFEIDVVSAVAELHGMYDAPLIILSAAASPNVSIQAVQAGASAYMVKPFSAHKFLDEVATHLLPNKCARMC